MSSKELSEWRAYELKNGPLDGEWRDNAIAHLVDISYFHAYMYSEVHYSDSKKNISGPLTAPEGVFPRPDKSFYPDPEPTAEEIAAADQLAVQRLNQELDRQ